MRGPLRSRRQPGRGCPAPITEQIEAELETLVSKIKSNLQRDHKLGQDHRKVMLALSRDFIRAKKIVGHGKFGAWLKANFVEGTDRTAQRYIELVEAANDIEAKTGLSSDSLADLPAAAIKALAKAPNDVQAKVAHAVAASINTASADMLDLINLKPKKTDEPEGLQAAKAKRGAVKDAAESGAAILEKLPPASIEKLNDWYAGFGGDFAVKLFDRLAQAPATTASGQAVKNLLTL